MVHTVGLLTKDETSKTIGRILYGLVPYISICLWKNILSNWKEDDILETPKWTCSLDIYLITVQLPCLRHFALSEVMTWF